MNATRILSVGRHPTDPRTILTTILMALGAVLGHGGIQENPPTMWMGNSGVLFSNAPFARSRP